MPSISPLFLMYCSLTVYVTFIQGWQDDVPEVVGPGPESLLRGRRPRICLDLQVVLTVSVIWLPSMLRATRIKVQGSPVHTPTHTHTLQSRHHGNTPTTGAN